LNKAQRQANISKKSAAKKPETKPKLTLASKTNFKPTAAAGKRLQPHKETKKMDTTSETKPASKTSFLPTPNPKPIKIKKEKTARDPNAVRVTGKSKELLQKVITVVAEKNPRRANSETYKIFELYKNGDTVEQFVKKGGRIIDAKADAERGHIKLSDAE
jgi:hypothetical protein